MKPKAPLVFRIKPELKKRLDEAAKRVGLKPYELTLRAMEAAVQAIEKNEGRLVAPIEFELEVTHVPRRVRYPAHDPARMTLNEEDSNSASQASPIEAARKAIGPSGKPEASLPPGIQPAQPPEDPTKKDKTFDLDTPPPPKVRGKGNPPKDKPGHPDKT